MFLPINQEKQYIQITDCQDGLEGQEFHDVGLKIVEIRKNLLNQMASNKKRILAEEISDSVEDYLQHKYEICQKFQKTTFALYDNQIQEERNSNITIQAPEVQELKDDFKQLKNLMSIYYK